MEEKSDQLDAQEKEALLEQFKRDQVRSALPHTLSFFFCNLYVHTCSQQYLAIYGVPAQYIGSTRICRMFLLPPEAYNEYI